MTNPPVTSARLVNPSGQASEEFQQWMLRQRKSLSDLSSDKAAKAQTWEQSFFIEYPTNKSYLVVLNAQIARTITNVVAKLASGTCSLKVKIATTALGAGAAISVTSTESNTAYTTNNDLDAADYIVFEITSASSPVDLSVTLYGTYNLA